MPEFGPHGALAVKRRSGLAAGDGGDVDEEGTVVARG
jgi:hypothetical protein